MTDYAVFIKMDHWLILYRILMSFVSFRKEYINTSLKKFILCDTLSVIIRLKNGYLDAFV